MAEHDFDSCPLATEIQKCDRERGEIMGTLKAIERTLARLEPMIQAHETFMQRSKGAMALIGVLSAIIGGAITVLFTWLTGTRH